MARFLTTAVLAAGVVLSSVPVQAQDEDAEPDAAFSDEITVALTPVVVRVVDREGYAIRDLEPSDLVVKVGKQEVPVSAVDWYSSGDFNPADRARGEDPPDVPGLVPRKLPLLEAVALEPNPVKKPGAPAAIEITGDLVVIFVQIGHHMVVTLDESYVGGHLKVLPHLRKLVRGLDPEDLVAVVSFDARLKLWQDFTTDREATADTLYRAIGFGDPARPPRAPGLSLLDHFDERAARRATNPELALKVVGEALKPLPGNKDVIFVGWGLGRLIYGVGVSLPRSYHQAVDALEAARTTVSVIDVTQASGHSLAAGLQTMTEATGGVYVSTYDNASRKIAELGHKLSGYYLVTIDRDALPKARGQLSIELRHRQGEVHYRRRALDGR